MSASPPPAKPLEKGSGTPIVFLHGYLLHRGMWAYQLDALSDRARVLLLDLPGYGTSANQAVPETLAGFSAAVAGSVEKWVGGPATIVGHSFGGYVALQMFKDRPDLFRGLVLLSTRSEGDAPEAREKRRATAQRLENASEHLDVDATTKGFVSEATWNAQGPLVALVKAMVASAPNKTVVGTLRAIADRPDLTGVLAGISVPTLAVWGAQDALIPPARTQALVLATPGARGVEIPGAGHLSPLEAPEAFNAAIRKFLPTVEAHRPA